MICLSQIRLTQSIELRVGMNKYEKPGRGHYALLLYQRRPDMSVTPAAATFN
jgi:hypothetical protein